MNRHRYIAFKDIKICHFGPYVLTDISNLETGGVSVRKINYVDTDGCEHRDIFYNERMFEISGFIQADNAEEMVKHKRRLISRCSLKEKFRIEYFNRKEKYSAECFFDKLPTFSKRTGWFLPFKLYAVIPGFYWESALMHTVDIFGYQDEIKDTFTLPCVFTSKFHSKTVSNLGDGEVYPVFVVKCNDSTVGSTIVIKNNTTGKKVLIDYQTSDYEVVTVDMYNQYVQSNMNGNITNKVSIDSEFFALEVGANDIEAISAGNVVVVQFRDRFLGV